MISTCRKRNVLDMTQEHSLRWQRTKEAWLRVLPLLLRRSDVCHRRSAALLYHQYIADGDVLDRRARYTGDDRRHVVCRCITDDVADDHPLERAHAGSGRRSQACAEAQKERLIADVTHGDAREGDVLDGPAVHALERKAATTLEDAVNDGDVFEAAVRFGTALDSRRSFARRRRRRALSRGCRCSTPRAGRPAGPS